MNKNLVLKTGYQNDKKYIKSFHKFISKIFPSISFTEWYQKGFWIDNYKPVSLFKDDEIISSACLAFLDITIDGKIYKAAQIGAVGTLEEYRNKGLSRKLMEHILNEYESKIDIFYLFANDSVLDFYPKFGFVPKTENVFIRKINFEKTESSFRKLDFDNKLDYEILINLLNNRLQLTGKFAPVNYQFITMWHIINLYKDNLFYSEKHNVIIVKREDEETLKIVDVIFNDLFDIEECLSELCSETITTVKYFFPPDILNFRYDKIEKDDTGLFVKGNCKLDESVFRYPLTAVT